MSGFWMATETEAGGNKFFNGRVFKLMFKLEQRKDMRIFPTKCQRETNTRICSYDYFTYKYYDLEMSYLVK